MIRVFVSGPVGARDEGRQARVDAAARAATELVAHGFAPFVPHLLNDNGRDAFASYEHAMAFCFVWLTQCEALLRIPGHSPGADREVEYARRRRISVFYSIEDLIAWRDERALPKGGGVKVPGCMRSDVI